MTEAVRKLQAGATLADLPERPGAPAAARRLAAQAGQRLLPWLVPLLLSLALITYWPATVLWLPSMMK